MPCDSSTLPSVSSIGIDLGFIDKFKLVSATALDTDSIYMRAKDTFKELFDGRKISEQEYANHAAAFISQLAATTTQSAMQIAMDWAKEENALPYTLAQLKANAENAMADREMKAHQICQIDKEIQLSCAKLEATIAASIRENGRVSEYDATGCRPISLIAEGTKLAQTKVLESQIYQTLADTYRKSGIVTVSTTADGIQKGTSANDAGLTRAQEKFAIRQIVSFEDSKRNHAANAMSQMIAQMLASEVPADPADITRWQTAINYLNTDSPVS
jgi:hypothetical protein